MTEKPCSLIGVNHSMSERGSRIEKRHGEAQRDVIGDRRRSRRRGRAAAEASSAADVHGHRDMHGDRAVRRSDARGPHASRYAAYSPRQCDIRGRRGCNAEVSPSFRTIDAVFVFAGRELRSSSRPAGAEPRHGRCGRQPASSLRRAIGHVIELVAEPGRSTARAHRATVCHCTAVQMRSTVAGSLGLVMRGSRRAPPLARRIRVTSATTADHAS